MECCSRTSAGASSPISARRGLGQLGMCEQMIAEGSIEASVDQSWVEICDDVGLVVATLPFERVARLQ